jgi:formate dehydrogenase (NADP+) beta subunit
VTSFARDMTPVINLTRERGAGAVRHQRPVYVDLLPPCNAACPAGENIQAWLGLAQAGNYRAAWEMLIRDNPLPAVHGRVCYHPCETGCNRKELDSAVSIHAVERFLGDRAMEQGWPMPVDKVTAGKRVLVVGAGPSGLSAAYHLTRLGHQVEIHDAGPLPGGMLHFGIPAYRLPREDLMKEIGRIEQMGVKFVPNHRVEDVLAEQTMGGFDAVFIAIGAHLSKHVDIPARDAIKVLDAVSLLRDVEADAAPRLGRRVVIYGGGNTAMDVARTVHRLGASEAMIVYRRDRAHMPAHDFEAEEALTEGVKIKWLTSIKAIAGVDLTVEVMRIDEGGRAQPTGEFETLQADTLVLALGQDADSGFLKKIPEIAFDADGSVVVAPNMMTGRAGIFAGGDMVPTERSVTVATGHGKKAAHHIDAWLRGEIYTPAAKHPVVAFAELNLPIYADAARSAQKELSVAQRGQGFDEVVSGLSQAEALHEAKRCLSCGNCFECDNCYAACPEDAIVKLGPNEGYAITLDLCTGCGVCVEQCPCHAMEMVAEPTEART